MSQALMGPILHELGAESDGVAIRWAKEPVVEAAEVCFALPTFVLACRERLQLDFPLDNIRRSLDVLLDRCRDIHARANIVTLAGIFQSYRNVSLDALDANSSMSPEAAEIIAELLEDELYQRLSSASWRIGIPARIDRAALLLGRYARRIAGSPQFKPVAKLTSKVISAASHIPVPDSDIGALVTKTGYMPPIINLGLQASRASEFYKKANSPLIAHPSVRERFGR